jgi:HK97 family phage prohead protease
MGDKDERGTAIAEPLRRKISDAAIRGAGHYAPDVEHGRMWFRASTNNLCPDGKVIEPGAWKRGMKQYMKNPIILDSHHYDSVVERTLGKAVDWEIDDLGLLLNVEFAQTSPGMAARYLYFEGFANAGSVGWDTIKSERATDEESGVDYERITQATLLEFSLCPVGADNEALSKHDNPLLETAARMLAAPSVESQPEGGAEVEAKDAVAGFFAAHKAIQEELGRIETLCVDIRTSLAAKSLVVEIADNDVTIVQEPEANPMAARLKEVADAVTLTPDEVMAQLRQFRQERD